MFKENQCYVLPESRPHTAESNNYLRMRMNGTVKTKNQYIKITYGAEKSFAQNTEKIQISPLLPKAGSLAATRTD